MKRQWILAFGVATALAGFAYVQNAGGHDDPAPHNHAEDAAVAEPVPGLETLRQRVSYIFGSNLGREFKANNFDIDVEALTRGVQDAIDGNDLKLSEAQIRETMAAFQQDMIARHEAQAQKNLEEGNAFLEANAKKDGVVTLESGLQYKVIKSGDGPSPKLTDTVSAHYRGTLIDGTEFDNSYKRGQPLTLPVGNVIPGWVEALQKMKVGDKWELYIPANLAYGEQGQGPIPPNSVLIFEMELLDIQE